MVEYQRQCDYETKTGFLYAKDEDLPKQLNDIFAGAKAVSIPVDCTDQVPTPQDLQKALVFEGQAKFNPLKYLRALA